MVELLARVELMVALEMAVREVILFFLRLLLPVVGLGLLMIPIQQEVQEDLVVVLLVHQTRVAQGTHLL